jgi:hypothetical protein
MDPQDFTPEYLISVHGRLYLWCEACRVSRDANLLALAAAGRGKQPLRAMKFACSACRQLRRSTRTAAQVSWWEAGATYSYDYSIGEKRRH